MPWNNQNGGGWKSGGGGGPWGQGGGSGGGGGGGSGQQPDLEELLKRSQDRLKRAMPGGGGGGMSRALIFIGLAGLIGFVAWHAFFFRVNPDQLGVVLRFGEYVRQVGPGLHQRWPYPIEEVELPSVTRQNRVEVGFRSRDGRGGDRVDRNKESLMLTGDENIVQLHFVVQWRIDDVQKFLFNIQNRASTVKEVAESAMREVIGQRALQPILTGERLEIELATQQLMQKTLDTYNAGIKIAKIKLQKVDPPEKVIAAFRDVQAATTDQVRLQNEARAYANRVVPEARGQAERILQAAEAYKQRQIAEAKGQASRFVQVYAEYKKAPEVTRRRLFLETMERVFGGTDKIILDNNKGGGGVVPYLPLDQLNRQRKATGGNN
ncbi:MAG: FtsH protease activity modulator HflK [Pseudomonadota bacterium]